MVFIAAVVGVSLAGDKGWPSRGDTVYISASFRNPRGVVTLVGMVPAEDSEAPPCIPLKVTRARPDRERWKTKDPAQNVQWLRGPWLSRMHHSPEECRAALAELGQPNVARQGAIHVIVPEE